MKRYLRLARFDHYVKNLFIVPGFVFNSISSQVPGNSFLESPQISWGVNRVVNLDFYWLLFSFVAVCLVSSANYTLNEYLDRSDDAHHPDKKSREAAKGG